MKKEPSDTFVNRIDQFKMKLPPIPINSSRSNNELALPQFGEPIPELASTSKKDDLSSRGGHTTINNEAQGSPMTAKFQTFEQVMNQPTKPTPQMHMSTFSPAQGMMYTNFGHGMPLAFPSPSP